ncbi:rhodanese-like domain-containing protein [Paenibacillus sp. HJL G12]|uniref:Rhodanese-like domain-containing protein n=1 Tax=Paenibacillus dendrobii TaxID=2691084 RepID=A0A7X3LEZ0_9BACL|nr:rhodanese-like domain-containing protein [Paenibacillus dendrobii]MWV43056.1 rhodanese-like domain-containing protein [Paenibacillus dendrobii]
MWWILIAVLAAGGAAWWFVREFSPVNGLTFVNPEELRGPERKGYELQMLDVRDSVDYMKYHVPGSINISMGRLPFVHQTQLASEEPVLILAENYRQTKRAARMLKRYGFMRIYAPQNGKEALGCGICCQ